MGQWDFNAADRDAAARIDAAMAEAQARAEQEGRRGESTRYGGRDAYGVANQPGPVSSFLSGLGGFFGDVYQLGEAQARTAAQQAAAEQAAPIAQQAAALPGVAPPPGDRLFSPEPFGSAPILPAGGFNQVQAPGLIDQFTNPQAAPVAPVQAPVQGPVYSPITASVQAPVTGAAPAVTGLLGGAPDMGSYPTTGDWSLAASDARMAGVTGFNDPLSGAYVDMGGGLFGGLLGGFGGGADGTGLAAGGGGGWGEGYAGGSGEGDGPGSTR